jgi:hypothetical protein
MFQVRVLVSLQNLGLITLSMSGSKLTIDYGVWCTPPLNTVRVRGRWVDRGGRLWFESILISEDNGFLHSTDVDNPEWN